MKKDTFIPKGLALKGRTKQQFMASVRQNGHEAHYSGRTITDKDGNVLRQKGFYIS